MVRLNKTIVAWFENGKMLEALLGEGKFFLPDHTHHDTHDFMLVCYVLIQWAYQSGKLDEIACEFEKALITICSTAPVKALDVLLAYAITARDLNRTIPCDLRSAFSALSVALGDGDNHLRGENVAVYKLRIADLRDRLTRFGVALSS